VSEKEYYNPTYAVLNPRSFARVNLFSSSGISGETNYEDLGGEVIPESNLPRYLTG
jgi:hypothetical protein